MKQSTENKSRFRILKGGKIALVISAILGNVTLTMASPIGGVVTSGTATISQTGATTNINQSTSKATINWHSFSIGSTEAVNFHQPDVNSITLNRVTGNERSLINGALNANGQVWLLNSNGILFGKSARVNTSGLLATTKNLSDTDFNNNNYTLKGDSTASVINLGKITINNSGYATLLAHSVNNEGTIQAIKGTIHLVGANQVSINFNGNSMLSLTIDKGVLDALVQNKGAVRADGGEIYLTTNAVNDLLKGVVNNTGVIEAHSLGDVTGKIQLFAHGGKVQVGGSLKAKDGFIETSGKDFTITPNTNIQAKKWLIDPTNLTIDTALASTTTATLNNGTDVTLQASNNIDIDAAMAWHQHILTLNAGNDININAQLDLTATAGLSFEYAQTTGSGTYNVQFPFPVNIASNGSFTTKQGANTAKTYTIINDVIALRKITNNLSGNYILGSNIDASSVKNFTSLGDFRGIFDGLGHIIDNVTQKNAYSITHTGLFSSSISTIANVGLTNMSLTHFGSASTHNYAGGLVAYNQGNINNSYVIGMIVTRQYFLGGLVGANIGGGTINNSYATVSFYRTSLGSIGGLVGSNNRSTINNSYATGSVIGVGSIGGLVGENRSSTISNSYATADVSGNGYVGGLVGENRSSTISNSYATGSLYTSTSNAGGLVGLNYGSTIENSYSTGSSSASGRGLIGSQYNGTVTNSFWDTTKSRKNSSADGIGLTTQEMEYGKVFKNAGWNISTNSSLTPGAPTLTSSGTWQIAPLALSYILSSKSSTYDGQDKQLNSFYNSPTTIFGGNYGINSVDYSFKVSGTSVNTYKHAGVYNNIKVASNNNFLTIKNSGNTDGTFTINPKALTLSGISENNKIYDGTTAATVNATLGGLISGDSVSIASSFDTPNVGTGKIVTLNALAGTDGANYYFATLGQTTTADITSAISPTLDSIITSITNKSAPQVASQLTAVPPKQLHNMGGNLVKLMNRNAPQLLVNAGINLPSGVEQQFSKPKDDKSKKGTK